MTNGLFSTKIHPFKASPGWHLTLSTNRSAIHGHVIVVSAPSYSTRSLRGMPPTLSKTRKTDQ
jgi:hypothetical protein